MRLISYTGGVSSSEPAANPVPWLGDKQWGELVRLSTCVAGFEGLEQAVALNSVSWKVGNQCQYNAVSLPF
jgi:hypothetical protein